MKKLLILLAFLPIAFVSSFGQGARFESVATTVTPPVTPGGFPTVLAIPGATVVLCNNNSSPCNSKVQTYTDITLGTPCSTSAQMTMPGSSTCTATTDVAGNIGFWFSPPTAGTLYYTETVGSATYGPYSFTVGACSSMINTWANLQKFYLGTTTQATWPGTLTSTPTQIDIESGSASVPTTGLYLSKPRFYLSSVDATTTSACESGFLNLCAAPVGKIEFTNLSTTTMSTMYGMTIAGSGFAANTQGSNASHNYPVGLGVAMRDSATPNIVNMANIDNNAGVNSVPAKCHFGVAGGVNTNCGRVSNGMETNQTVAVATDGTVDETQIGNLVYGQTINLNSTGGGNGSYALNITSNTSGKGWQFGVGIGGALQTGLVIPQQGSSFKPNIAMHIATQGPYGIVCGTGSTTYTHSAIWTFGNPSTACLLLDVARAEGATSAAGSNFLQWRSATGAATYQNFRTYLGTSNDWHMQSDASGAFADVMQLIGNATPAAQTVSVTGSFVASSTILFKNTGGNSFTLTGTPTGTDVWQFQDTLADVVVGRATTDTLTNKTLTSPAINSGALVTPTIGGETITKAPRMTFPCFVSSLNGVATYCAFVTEQPITLTRIVIQQITGSTGCATFPVVSAFNATGSAILSSVTESAAASIDSGAISVAVAAAQSVVVRVTTAGVTCSPTAANVTVTLQYKMQ